jgi:uroporphyrinogen-III synthase
LRLLHLCGADRQAVDRRITAIIVYHSSPIPSPDLSEAAGSVALIHSPRAGRRLAELIGAKGGIAIAAISPAAAKAAGTGWEGVEAADRPSDDALLALAARLCNKPAPQ